MTGRTEPGRTYKKRRPQKRASFLKEMIYNCRSFLLLLSHGVGAPLHV